MLAAIDWLLRQCVASAIACALLGGRLPRDGRVEGLLFYHVGDEVRVSVEWSEG